MVVVDMMFVLLLSIVDDVISIGCCIKMSMKIMRTDMLCNDRTSLFDISCPVFEFGRCQVSTADSEVVLLFSFESD